MTITWPAEAMATSLINIFYRAQAPPSTPPRPQHKKCARDIEPPPTKFTTRPEKITIIVDGTVLFIAKEQTRKSWDVLRTAIKSMTDHLVTQHLRHPTLPQIQRYSISWIVVYKHTANMTIRENGLDGLAYVFQDVCAANMQVDTARLMIVPDGFSLYLGELLQTNPEIDTESAYQAWQNEPEENKQSFTTNAVGNKSTFKRLKHELWIGNEIDDMYLLYTARKMSRTCRTTKKGDIIIGECDHMRFYMFTYMSSDGALGDIYNHFSSENKSKQKIVSLTPSKIGIDDVKHELGDVIILSQDRNRGIDGNSIETEKYNQIIKSMEGLTMIYDRMSCDGRVQCSSPPKSISENFKNFLFQNVNIKRDVPAGRSDELRPTQIAHMSNESTAPGPSVVTEEERSAETTRDTSSRPAGSTMATQQNTEAPRVPRPPTQKGGRGGRGRMHSL